MRKTRIVLAIVAAYLILILFGHLPDHLILFPTKAPIDAGEAALHVARQRPVAGLILHNPLPLRQMILRRFGWWNLWLLAGPIALQIPRELDSISNAKAIQTPAIFLLAEKDEIVPPRYHRLVVDAYAGQKRVISLPGAYHNDPVEGAALAELNHALDWLLPKTKN